LHQRLEHRGRLWPQNHPAFAAKELTAAGDEAEFPEAVDDVLIVIRHVTYSARSDVAIRHDDPSW
jgi:hypothetical protein